MFWISIALGGYLLNAGASVLDKYILHSRIPKPSVYAFYVGIFSLFAVGFIPFVGIQWHGWKEFGWAVLAGIFFIYGLLALYKAVKENEVSRVAPLVGTIIPIVSILFAYLFLDERLGWTSWLAFCLMVIGGFLISFDLPLKQKQIFKGFRYSLLAGILLAASFGVRKIIYTDQQFLSGFIWSRIGFFMASLSLLLIPQFYREIVGKHKKKKNSGKQLTVTGSIFVANKVLAAVGTFLIDQSIAIGSVTLVHAMSGAQFAFVLVLVAIFSRQHQHVFQEKLEFWDWAQKVGAIFLIAIGIGLLALGEAHGLKINFS